MIGEVAAELDRAGIAIISLMITGEDLVVVTIPSVCDYHRALKTFETSHGRSSWRGMVVRVHVGRRVRSLRAHTGGDAA